MTHISPYNLIDFSCSAIDTEIYMIILHVKSEMPHASAAKMLYSNIVFQSIVP